MLTVLALVIPGRASVAVAFQFNGTAELPVIPCSTGGCVGTLTGTARGAFENGNSTNAPITATFIYQEVRCDFGVVSGTGQINGVAWTFSGQRQGTSLIFVGRYGPHGLTGRAAGRFTPLVPSGCLDPNHPSSATWTFTGIGWGV